jgi:hypothetical protein
VTLCWCGVMATDRCADCRTSVCRNHGSLQWDHLVEALRTDIGGVITHWRGSVQTFDGSFRCDQCLRKHAHELYAEASYRGAAALPPLPSEPYLRVCAVAAGGFAIEDPEVDRSVSTFASEVVESCSSGHVPFNGHVMRERRTRFSTKQDARGSWEFLLDPSRADDPEQPSLHVLDDGSVEFDPPEASTAEVPDYVMGQLARFVGL